MSWLVANEAASTVSLIPLSRSAWACAKARGQTGGGGRPYRGPAPAALAGAGSIPWILANFAFQSSLSQRVQL